MSCSASAAAGRRRRARAVAVGHPAGRNGDRAARRRDGCRSAVSSPSKSSIASHRRVRFSTPGTASGSSSSPISWAAARWATGKAPGRRNTPDATEYVRIRGDQLQPKDGRFEIRVTNELEETLFADRFQLLAIAHPRDIDVYPNEGMTESPKPYRLFAVRDERVPRATSRRSRSRRDRSHRPRSIAVSRTASRSNRSAATPRLTR